MKYYIGTSLLNDVSHNLLRDALAALGHEITYDWTVHGPAWDLGEEKLREIALLEINGIREADLVIIILPGGRGTHVELGVAIGMEKPIYLISDSMDLLTLCPDTCAFYWPKQVQKCPTAITPAMFFDADIMKSLTNVIDMMFEIKKEVSHGTL